jgi:hypothetical protein
LPRAPATAEATKGAGRNPSRTSDATLGRVDPPSTRFRTYTEGDLFVVSVPSNWQELASSDSSVTFAPDGGYGRVGQRNVFTHGIEFGLVRAGSRDLRTASNQLIQSLRQSNPDLRQSGSYQNGTIHGRRAVRTQLTNVSEATGREERIDFFSTLLDNGTLFYAVGVAPRESFSSYQQVFGRIMGSVQFQGS